MTRCEIVEGDALERLKQMPEASAQMCVTSPPYWGLRDYKSPGQRGLERTLAEYLERMVEVFEQVRRVLRKDGTLWLNMGDCYIAAPKGPGGDDKSTLTKSGVEHQRVKSAASFRRDRADVGNEKHRRGDLKPKDLVGMPWRLALALQDEGWWLRSDIIWSKPNPMPESVTDRPTRAHEYIFLLAKSRRYFYDADAIREPFADGRMGRDYKTPDGWDTSAGSHVWRPASERNRGGRTDGFTKPNNIDPSANGGRNVRSVWSMSTQPFPEAHFATFPEELPERCIKAGSSAMGCCEECGAPLRRVTESNATGGAGLPRLDRIDTTVGWARTCDHAAGFRPCLVLDPFAGAGTTGLVAHRLGRDFVGIELNPTYAAMARRRIHDDAPLLMDGA